jgi:hypothetical protein
MPDRDDRVPLRWLGEFVVRRIDDAITARLEERP